MANGCSGEKELDLAPIRRLEEAEFPGSRAEKDALQRILRTKNDCLEFIKEKVGYYHRFNIQLHCVPAG